MTQLNNGQIDNHAMFNTTIGVLGCGFVGEQVLRQFTWSNQNSHSWFTHRLGSSAKAIDNYQAIGFDIDDNNTWSNLPKHADCLLVTLPPKHKNIQDETQRLAAWCQWMQANRAGITKLIYISTTGVYAETPGHFDESSPCKPSHLRGELRLVSEQVLAQYFDMVTVRCGGIYGPKRNIISKIKSGKAIFAGNKKVYRIHVEDLANMVALIATQWPTLDVFHGVDGKSTSQDEVIAWLKTQAVWEVLAASFKLQTKRLDDDLAPRVIAQQNVFNEFGYRLRYPEIFYGIDESAKRTLE